MSLGTPVLGTIAYSAANASSVAPTYPTGIGANDVLVMLIGQKPSAANGGTVTTPAGWTLREERTAAGGYGTTLTSDVGNTNLRCYTKDAVSGSESGTLTVTVGTNGICWAAIVLVPTDGGAISYGATDGEQTAGGNVSLAGGTNPGFSTGDLALWALCIPTDVTTPGQFSAHAITASGAIFGAATELGEPDTSLGNDIGGLMAWALVSAGTSTAAPTFAATAGGTTTNVRSPGVILRIREAVAADHVYKGSAGWSAFYKGVRSDAALYKGAKSLHP